jgi:hypothetical protein
MTHKANSRHNSHGGRKVEQTEMQRQADVMTTSPKGLYERFRRGLLEYHSEVHRPPIHKEGADGRMRGNISNRCEKRNAFKSFNPISQKSGD